MMTRHRPRLSFMMKGRIPAMSVPDTHGERGATMVEYAIMLALIATVSMVVITTIGQDVLGAFASAKW